MSRRSYTIKVSEQEYLEKKKMFDEAFPRLKFVESRERNVGSSISYPCGGTRSWIYEYGIFDSNGNPSGFFLIKSEMDCLCGHEKYVDSHIKARNGETLFYESTKTLYSKSGWVNSVTNFFSVGNNLDNFLEKLKKGN